MKRNPAGPLQWSDPLSTVLVQTAILVLGLWLGVSGLRSSEGGGTASRGAQLGVRYAEDVFSQIQGSSVGNISGYIPARGTRQRSRPMQASLEVLEWRCDSSSSEVNAGVVSAGPW